MASSGCTTRAWNTISCVAPCARKNDRRRLIVELSTACAGRRAALKLARSVLFVQPFGGEGVGHGDGPGPPRGQESPAHGGRPRGERARRGPVDERAQGRKPVGDGWRPASRHHYRA